MEILEISRQELQASPRGVQVRRLVERPAVAVVNIVLQPGEKVPSHATPVDVYFHVLEGRGAVEIGCEREDVREGQIIISPAHIPHALYAASDSPFSVLVVKTPNPEGREAQGGSGS